MMSSPNSPMLCTFGSCSEHATHKAVTATGRMWLCPSHRRMLEFEGVTTVAIWQWDDSMVYNVLHALTPAVRS